MDKENDDEIKKDDKEKNKIVADENKELSKKKNKKIDNESKNNNKETKVGSKNKKKLEIEKSAKEETKNEKVKESTKEEKKDRVENNLKEEKIEDKVKPKKKKKIILFIIIGSILFLFLIIFIIYVFAIPFNVSSNLEGDRKTTTGELTFELEIKGNKPIVGTYYSIDPVNENDKREYEKVIGTGSLFSKKFEFNKLQIPVGKRKICLYVESYFFTHDVVCEDLEHDMGYINSFNSENVVNINNNFRAVKDELLITFKDNVSKSEIEKIIKKYNGDIVGQIYFANFYQVKFEVKNIKDLTSLYERIKEESIVDTIGYNSVTSTELNYEVNDSVYKNDDWNNERPSGRNWYLEVIEATEAWDLIEKPKKINVGVIDNPIDYKHQDINLPIKNIFYLPSKDFPKYDDVILYINNHKRDENYANQHGTHVSGIISALHNDIGSAGVGLNVNLFYSNEWRFEYNKHDEDAASLVFALSNLVMSNCRVINMSIEADNYKELVNEQNEDYLDYIGLIDKIFKKYDELGKDFVITKSAGNKSDDASKYLLNYIFRHSKYASPHVIIVGAVDKVDASKMEENSEIVYSRAAKSNYGNYVDVFAPGVDIISPAIAPDKSIFMSGTSQAAPIVAGIAELIYSVNPNLKYTDVIKMIKNVDDKVLDNNGEIGYIVNAKKSVQATLEFDGELKEPEIKEKYGYIQGTIVDAKTDKPIDKSVSITLINHEESKFYLANVTIGGYNLILPTGTYELQVKCDGYLSETIYDVVVTEDIVTYNIKLPMVNDDNKNEDGTVKGTVKDAIVRDKKVPNATLKFYRGINNTGLNSKEVLTIESDNYGNYEAKLKPGNYTVVVSADNYITSNSYVVSIPKTTKSNQDCTISPILNEGEIRVVLTWDYNPYDLDSHLIGPTPTNEKFHVFYSNKNYNFEGTKYDNLDVDDRNSYGPETISVYKNVNGEYLYLVHDYTNRSKTDSSALGNSSAQVKLYVAGRKEPYIFNVPNKSGTVWKVFKLVNGEVVPINEMSYESNSSNVGK